MNLIKSVFFLLALVVGAAAWAEPVNINTADAATLMQMKGVGEKLAQAIVAYREQHGPFKHVQDLSEVHGIGAAVIEKNLDNLTVGETAEEQPADDSKQ